MLTHSILFLLELGRACVPRKPRPAQVIREPLVQRGLALAGTARWGPGAGRRRLPGAVDAKRGALADPTSMGGSDLDGRILLRWADPTTMGGLLERRAFWGAVGGGWEVGAPDPGPGEEVDLTSHHPEWSPQ